MAGTGQAGAAFPGPGFAVLYRWRLHPGTEDDFVRAWSRVSELLRSQRGSLGSRLHRGPDGIWYSYAQWPSAQARDAAFAADSVDPQAIAERLPELVLESVANIMLPIADNGG